MSRAELSLAVMVVGFVVLLFAKRDRFERLGGLIVLLGALLDVGQ